MDSVQPFSFMLMILATPFVYKILHGQGVTVSLYANNIGFALCLQNITWAGCNRLALC